MKELIEAPFAITTCDTNGNITGMNNRSTKTFEKYGGKERIGKSLFECHPEAASAKLRELLITHQVNAYTIEKNGIKKLIYQCPHFENGEFSGYIELSLELPAEMPHYVRKS